MPEAAPRQDIGFAPVKIKVDHAPGGVQVLRSELPLEPYETNLGSLLRRWAADAPDRVFLGERGGDGWREVTYAEAATAAEALGQALLDRGLGPERPLLILSGNSVDHALLALAGQLVGVPVVPVSVAYSTLSKDHGKLRAIAELVAPGLVFADQGEPFAKALASLPQPRPEIVVGGAPPAGLAATDFATLLATRPTGDVSAAAARVGPDTVAKILFTSGSTGQPKGVITTHRMLCANQQMMAQVWPFAAAGDPPVLVDWLPWSHTFGGNFVFNLALRHGGSLYVDKGRPAPGMIEETVRSLADVSPTMYFNVPAGYGALLPFLERDPELAAKFFARLRLIFYAAAALPQDLWERLGAVSARATGARVPMTSAWGATETAPAATAAHFPLTRAGNIGVPVPGVELKLVPHGGKLELRVRGPNVTPGYLGRPDLTEAGFDDEGFYRTGDAAQLADPDDPGKGLLFEGRTAEDFKLSSGTWVHTGKLRVAALAAASPLLSDAVVAGADRDELGLLVWLNLAEASRVAALPDGDAEAMTRAQAVADGIRAGLTTYNTEQAGSSTRVARVLVMAEPPSIDAGEITDKGYVNQRATLDRRHALVERLFADPPAPDVIVL